MAIEVNVGSSWKDLANCEVNVGASWKQVQAIEINVGGTWKTVWTNLTLSASNVSGSDSGFSASGSVTTSTSTSTTPSGGTAPYTYSWARLTGADGNAFNISSATAQNPSWEAVRDDSDVDNTETWRCTVTDDDGTTATADISVTLTWTNLS